MLENTFTSIPDMAKRLFHIFVIDYIPYWIYKNLVKWRDLNRTEKQIRFFV